MHNRTGCRKFLLGMQHQPIHRFSTLPGVASPHGAVPFCLAAAAYWMLACLFCMHSRWRVIRVVCGAERAARSVGTCARAWACCCGCSTCCPGVCGCGDDSGGYLGSCCCVIHITPFCSEKQMLPPTAYALLSITTGHTLPSVTLVWLPMARENLHGLQGCGKRPAGYTARCSRHTKRSESAGIRQSKSLC